MSNNAVTIENLRKQGRKVRVHHWRYTEAKNSGLISTTLFVSVPVTNKGNRFKTPVLQSTNQITERSSWMSPNGGKTLVEVTTTLPNGQEQTVSSEAICSRKDNFNRKLGVRIALGRIADHLAAV